MKLAPSRPQTPGPAHNRLFDRNGMGDQHDCANRGHLRGGQIQPDQNRECRDSAIKPRKNRAQADDCGLGRQVERCHGRAQCRAERKIPDDLQRDASIRNVDLADRVDLAPSSCLRRVRKLWKSGVITRAVVLTDGEKMGRNVTAIVTVTLADHSNVARKDWQALLTRERAVTQAYTVSGEADAVILMSLMNMKEYQDLSQSLFAGDPNIVQFVTQFVLETHKFEPAQ